jgi:hypothetical protein
MFTLLHEIDEFDAREKKITEELSQLKFALSPENVLKDEEVVEDGDTDLSDDVFKSEHSAVVQLMLEVKQKVQTLIANKAKFEEDDKTEDLKNQSKFQLT